VKIDRAPKLLLRQMVAGPARPLAKASNQLALIKKGA
jgi:hypothetical protein